MTACTACRLAGTDPHSGLYHADCPGCEVRAVAKSPGRLRAIAYGEREGEARAAFVAAVAAEFARLRELRDALRPGTTFTAAGRQG